MCMKFIYAYVWQVNFKPNDTQVVIIIMIIYIYIVLYVLYTHNHGIKWGT